MCVFLDMHLADKPEVMIGGAADAFDSEGRLVDETTRGFVRGLLAALAA